MALNYTIRSEPATINGATITLDGTADIITADIDALETSFNYYPNPVKDVMTVELPLDKSSDIQLQILDLSGRAIQMNKFNNKRTLNTQLNVYGLTAGQYLLMITTENNRKAERITITK